MTGVKMKDFYIVTVGAAGSGDHRSADDLPRSKLFSGRVTGGAGECDDRKTCRAFTGTEYRQIVGGCPEIKTRTLDVGRNLHLALGLMLQAHRANDADSIREDE
jgi:hypothetical protein